MSIIIRLQNLPWAANSVDIRRYFVGLSIPEGGVHIVGGEKGDAFIAFSTDEDARQAMERDGGKIKDMKVKLLLSSRAEMTRVIEQARNQNLSLQTPAVTKAAANDSDRRKIHDRSPSPSRSRKEREKSPPPSRDRRKLSSSYSKRERSRSRSPRRVDRDRDVDRRSDRSKRDDRTRYDDRGDSRYRSSRDYGSRDPSQDQKLDSSKAQPDLNQDKSSDPRMGATPQSFDSRHLDGGGIRTGGMEFNPRQANLPDSSLSYIDPRNQLASGSNASPYIFPAAMNASIKIDTKSVPLQPPSFPILGAFSSPFNEKEPIEARSTGSYETKRPSPTPAALAPKVGSSSPYAKAYSMSSRADPYNSVSGGFGNCPDPTTPTYGTVQTAEKGAVPAVPHDRKSVLTSKPVYGAEPHARYEQIPEANQASRSSAAPVPADDSTPYNKRVPSTAPPTSSSSANITTAKPPRRSRFEPENTPPNDPFNLSKNDARSSSLVHSSRPTDKNNHSIPGMDSSDILPRDKALARKGSPWSEQLPSASSSHRPALLTPPQHPDEFSQVIPMDIDNDEANASPSTLPSSSRMSGHPLRRENQDSRPQNSRGYFPNTSESQMDSSFEDSASTRARGQPLLRDSERSPLIKGAPPLGRDRGPSLSVEVRNLPYDVIENDVLELFRGIFVPPENLKLQRNSRGQPNGCAFVKFLKPRDCEEALSRSRQKNIGGVYPEVIACPLAVFENAPVLKPPSRMDDIDSAPSLRPNVRSHDDDFCVEVKGLPVSFTEDDVVRFFDGLRILDILMMPNTEGRGSMSAFVEFGTSADFYAALDLTGKMIGHRYVTVTTTKKEIMHRAYEERRSGKEPLFPQPSPREVLPPTPRAHNKMSRPPGPQDGPMYCVVINNLPKVVKNRDIADFFAEDKVVPRAIHIMLDANKLPSGEAFAEFTSVHEFEAALQRNGKILAGCRISVNPISYQEMTDILKGPPTAPPQPLLRSPPDGDRPARRPLMPMPPPRDEDIMRDRRPLDNMSPDDFGPGRHRMDSRFPSNDRSFEHSEPLMGARPSFNRMRGPVPPRPGSRPPRPPLFGPDGPSPRGPPRFRSSGPSRMPPPPPHSQGDGPKDFGRPGCVVAINNLHFHAGLDELMEAFRGFPIDKDNIIRKYNEKGQPTGEARVAFQTHEDAVRAVEEVNQKIIFGRPLYLSLV